ncbi:MAG: prepilin-type N-terminal cleavage/methylation domain-containing protein [Gammaproteobacteria bacterium]|nr:prepilin-type N-terminal cleavage/methylation domain-containing protein [Gammaproteobacteria bacterium]MDJ0871549.1 prepilin-type N-terminal cleavage/methylation domain-containing protein [Gammaproteobacteria bacterium]MDJ0890786.1 prepilin-type N-terminal cleavage/methylation domain-containing protein [Gammaproteobacteria bacterium]
MSRAVVERRRHCIAVRGAGAQQATRATLRGHGQGGFTLFELAIVVAIISTLAILAIDRIWALRMDAERAAVAQVVGSLRSALGLEVASRAVRNGLRSVPELEGSNPMALMAQVPPGYLGELEQVDAALLDGGQWYFDPGDGALVYLVRFRGSFETTLQAPQRLRFRIVLRYEDVDESSRFEPARDRVHGLDLIPMEPYS